MLGEPTNDVDTDTLAAMEDLLDTWPGTLVVISHDRYLLERVTDTQYAILDGRLRHLPGGVDEYLRLRQLASRPPAPATTGPTVAAAASPGLSGAERRAAQKEVASIERRLDKLGVQVDDLHRRMAGHDQSDFEGLQRLADQLRATEVETADLEERWIELSEQVS